MSRALPFWLRIAGGFGFAGWVNAIGVGCGLLSLGSKGAPDSVAYAVLTYLHLLLRVPAVSATLFLVPNALLGAWALSVIERGALPRSPRALRRWALATMIFGAANLCASAVMTYFTRYDVDAGRRAVFWWMSATSVISAIGALFLLAALRKLRVQVT